MEGAVGTTRETDGPLSAPAADDAVDPSQRVLRVQRSRRSFSLDWGELWQYRELLYFLVWRDVKVRYKQTMIGVAWAVIQPLTSMLIFTVVFGRLAGIKGDYGLPYPLFVFSGLLPWTYFASSLAQSSSSLVGNANLLSKVYFPRLVIPLGSIVVPVIDFAISFVILVGLFIVYGRFPSWHVVALPLFLLLALLTAFGVGLWLSALNVRYRDVPYAMPFLTQIWLYVTPVVYPVTLVPQDWRWLVALNPMAGVVDGFRWSVLGEGHPHVGVLTISAAVSIVVVLGGLWYFKRSERTFADVI